MVEDPAPAVLESVSVFEHAVDVLDLVAACVSGEPGWCAPGDSLVGVELFGGDGDGAFAAVFVVDEGY